MKIVPIILSLSVVFFTWLLLRSGMTAYRFIIVTFVWVMVGFLFFMADNKLEYFKVLLQGLSILLAFAAFAIAVLTFSLQQTPLLVLQGLNLVDGEQRIYLFFQNKGTIAAYNMSGAFVITSHQELELGKTSKEKVLSFGRIDIKNEAFYPNTNNVDVVSVPFSMKGKISEQQDHVYFSLAVNYPRLQIGAFEVPL